MNCRRKLFLDTTIQIDRLFETLDRKRRILGKIAGCDCYTCTLVLREFKALVLDSSISLYSIIEECCSDPDVLTEISREFSKSIESMMLKIYAEVKREAGLNASFDRELALATLRSYIDGRLLARFRKVLAEQESDLTECEVARYEVQESDGMFELEVHCNRKRANCNLPQIYKDNEKRLKRIKELLEGKSDTDCKLEARERHEFGRINEVSSQVVKHSDWNIVKGQRNCDRLADLTILIESPPGSAVYTTDKGYDYLFNRLDFPDKEPPEIESYT
jgi:hypothetical protein